MLYEHQCACIFINVGLGGFPRVELLEQMVILFLIFWETSIQISTIYIPTNRVKGFPFLHILASICYLCSFWWLSFWQVWGDSSLWSYKINSFNYRFYVPISHSTMIFQGFILFFCLPFVLIFNFSWTF